MRFALFALLVFGVLTIWLPAYWPVAVFQSGVFTLCGLTAWKARSSGVRFPFSYPVIPAAFAVVWGLVQIATAHTAYAFPTQTAVLRWSAFLGIILVGSDVFRDPASLRWFRSAMLWFAFGVAVFATLQTFTSGGKVFWLFPSGYVYRVMGPFVSPNDYACFIIAVLPFALYAALRGESGKVLHSGMAAVMYASVIASASRAGSVLATAEIAAVVALMFTRKHIALRTAAASLLRMALLFVAFTLVVGWTHVWERFRAPDPVHFRSELNISSLHMIEANPFWGIGLGAWPTVYPKYALIDVGLNANQAHNDWLQWAAEGGIPMALVLATLPVWAFPRAVRSVWGLGILAVFALAVVDYPFSRVVLGCWCMTVAAMLSPLGSRTDHPSQL